MTIIIYKCNKYPEVNFMYALAFKDKILYRGSYREVLDHCFILRKEQGYLLSDSRYKLLNLEDLSESTTQSLNGYFAHCSC